MKPPPAWKKMAMLLPLCAAVFGAPEGRAHTVQVEESLHLRVELVPSQDHAFAYVRAYRDGEGLVLYGKVEHRHGSGRLPEGYVEATFLDERGEVARSARLPVVDRGTRRKGWRGAHFRMRMDLPGPAAETLQLRLRDVTLFPAAPSCPTAVRGSHP